MFVTFLDQVSPRTILKRAGGSVKSASPFSSQVPLLIVNPPAEKVLRAGVANFRNIATISLNSEKIAQIGIYLNLFSKYKSIYALQVKSGP